MGVADELERLARLHRDGALTDEDYAAAKAAAIAQSSSGQGSSALLDRYAYNARVVLAVLGALAFISLFMTWLNLLLFSLSGFDLARIGFGLDSFLQDLGEVFGVEDGGIGPGARILVVVLALAFLAMATASAWPSAKRRNVQALIGSVPLLLFMMNALFNFRDSLQFIGGGFLLFSLATLATVVVAVVDLRGDTSGRSRPSFRLPVERFRAMRDSRRARQLLVIVPLVLLLALGGNWVLSPGSASGPITVEYVFGPISDEGRRPLRDASVVIGSGGEQTDIELPVREPADGDGTAVRFAAGEWRTGESVRVSYRPSLSREMARDAGFDDLDERQWFDTNLIRTIDMPEQPTRLSRFRTEELVIRIEIAERSTDVAFDHEGFGRMFETALARAEEPELQRLADLARQRQARIDQAVTDSCIAIQRSWRRVFGTFNRAEAELFDRNWNVSGSLAYTEWQRRATAMRNGLVDPFNATDSRNAAVALTARPVQGGAAEIEAINRRITTAVNSARADLRVYVMVWDDVIRAARLQSNSLWETSNTRAANLRRAARANASINFDCGIPRSGS